MRLKMMTLAGTILLVLAFTIGIAGAANQNATDNGTTTVTITENPTEKLPVPAADDNISDEGIFGPGSALYGLQIAFDNIGEIFTFNASEKLGKQVSNARKRIAEARYALKRNDTEAADKALAEYDAKIRDINDTMSGLSRNDTGLINAREMILKHQLILENLSISNPDNKGLERAYNNSRELQSKFESKLEERPDLNITRRERDIATGKKPEVTPTVERPEKGEKK
ncbi:Uncharacterised protein [uncultured archaeon]|nr:Uncharacterised protein [uncultured archaeon]